MLFPIEAAQSDTKQNLNPASRGDLNCTIVYDTSINPQINILHLTDLFGDDDDFVGRDIQINCNGTTFSAEMSGHKEPSHANNKFTWNALRGDYFNIYKSDRYTAFAMINDHVEAGLLSRRVRLCAENVTYSESSRFIHVNCNNQDGNQIEIKVFSSVSKKYSICAISAMNDQATVYIYMSGTTAICEGDIATLASFLSTIGANLGFYPND